MKKRRSRTGSSCELQEIRNLARLSQVDSLMIADDPVSTRGFDRYAAREIDTSINEPVVETLKYGGQCVPLSDQLMAEGTKRAAIFKSPESNAINEM